MEELVDYRARLMERLLEQLNELRTAIDAIPASEWHTRRTPDGSTIHQHAAHVRDLEVQAFAPRFQRVVTEDNPALEPYTSHHFSDASYQPDEPMVKILAEFAAAREAAVSQMRALRAEDWSRAGFHPPSGQRTAQWWAERMYGHVREHLEEVRGLSTDRTE